LDWMEHGLGLTGMDRVASALRFAENRLAPGQVCMLDRFRSRQSQRVSGEQGTIHHLSRCLGCSTEPPQQVDQSLTENLLFGGHLLGRCFRSTCWQPSISSRAASQIRFGRLAVTEPSISSQAMHLSTHFACASTTVMPQIQLRHMYAPWTSQLEIHFRSPLR
jgi:hypothetical protein